MARLKENLVSGLVEDDPLASSATTLNSAALALLDEVVDPDIAVIILDPQAVNGRPEIVHVTAHTAAATSATILRAQEQSEGGGAARQHPAGTQWVHGPTVQDYNSPVVTNLTVNENVTVEGDITVENVMVNENVTVEGDLHVHEEFRLGDTIINEEALIGTLNKTAYLFIPGELTVDSAPIQLMMPIALEVVDVTARVTGAPTSADLIIDVNKNGTTIFTTQANRPTIEAGQTVGTDAVPDVVEFAEDDVLTFDVDQIGSGDPGEHLTLRIRFKVPHPETPEE